MKIAVVGAGFAGLSTAKVLREFGHEVVVFDKAPDVGGVWSVTRRYPGVRAQNNKGTYALSDLRLPRLGLVPDGTFEDIARSTVSLATDGFYEAVAGGRISVLRDNTIRGFAEQDGRPYAELADGTAVPADLVVCGAGFRQRVPFFDEAVLKRLTDDRGNFELYRQILPHDVPDLTFAGYNSSLFSPLSAEMSAVWIASHLAGLHQVPPAQERRRMVAARLAWMEKRTNGQHARGTNIIPFSMHNIDEVLGELGLNIGKGRRARQWLLPVNPKSYRTVAKKLKKRYQQAQSRT